MYLAPPYLLHMQAPSMPISALFTMVQYRMDIEEQDSCDILVSMKIQLQ